MTTLLLPLQLWLAVLAGATTTRPAAAVPQRHRGILLLFSNGPYAAADSLFTGALQRELRASHSDADIFVEYLETGRLRLAGHEAALVRLLRAKYGARIDVVVPVWYPALAFLTRHRQELFPDAPVVFAGSAPSGSVAALAPDVAVVVARTDPVGTLAIALDLHPDTRQVVVVTGAPPWDRDRTQHLQEALAPFQDRVHLSYLDADVVPFEEILGQLAQLPPHTVVLYRSVTGRRETGMLEPDQALRLIHQVANAPIYGLHDAFVGLGVVGGRVLQLDRWAGAVAAAVDAELRGGRASAVPDVQIASSVPMFDWRELERWHISEARLPAGSIVRFRQPSFWERHQAHALEVGALIGLQALTIGGLLAERRQRRAAERSLKRATTRQLSELEGRHHHDDAARIARIGTLGELAASLAHELNQPLSAIRANAEAARRFLDGPRPRVDEVREILADIDADDRRAGEVIHRIRALLKHHQVEMVHLSVNDVVRDVIQLVRSDAVLRHIATVLDLDESVPKALGDGVQLQQVVLNLVLNGLQAMESAPPADRRLMIRTGRVDGFVQVCVRDAGPGVRLEDVDRLFDPFFTTKPGGLGMGLSIARSIVEGHGGRIWATNNSDRGATFHVALPVAGSLS